MLLFFYSFDFQNKKIRVIRVISGQKRAFREHHPTAAPLLFALARCPLSTPLPQNRAPVLCFAVEFR